MVTKPSANRNWLKKLLSKLGPGIITGAADDDPSGIATYSQTGAQFGYKQLWLAVFMLPMLVAVQELCVRIGAVTGKGIAAVIKKYYSKKLLYPVVLLILIANTINIGADIGSMAAVFKLLVPVNFIILTLLFTVIIVLLEIFISYKTYAKILKWLCLSLLAYPITVFLIKAPWLTLLKATFIPHLELNYKFLFILIGVLGTTISPYLFFWQACEAVEEEKCASVPKQNGKPLLPRGLLKKFRIDNFMGMFSSEVATWSIIVVTGTVLHTHGILDIKTAADAAKALEPLVNFFPHAGFIAKLIFAIGVLGLGFLSIPVLAGSAAYAFGEAVAWKTGLNYRFKQAPQFYGVIILAMLLGLALNFVGIDPMKALVYSAVINGVVAVPLLMIISIIGANKKIMGKHSSGIFSKVMVWITFAIMGAATIGMFFMFGKN